MGNKAIQRSGPRIISVKPSPAGAGAEVTVSGVNLVPPKTSKEVAKSQTVVQLTLPDGTVRVLAPENATAVAVTFVVPDDVVGQVIVAIVTMLGVATDTATLRIA